MIYPLIFIFLIFVLACLPKLKLFKKRTAPKHFQIDEPIDFKNAKIDTFSKLVKEVNERKYHLSNCTCIKLVWICAENCPARNT